MTVKQLKEELESINLHVSGRKQELVDRMMRHIPNSNPTPTATIPSSNPSPTATHDDEASDGKANNDEDDDKHHHNALIEILKELD